MKVGNALLGALIGAGVGLAAYLGLEVGAGVEAGWFAVVIGLLTGLGVRMCDASVKTQGSVARAALSGVVALAATIGGSLLASQMVVSKSQAAKAPVLGQASPTEPAEDAASDAAEDTGDESAEETTEDTEEPPAEAPLIDAAASDPGSDARVQEFEPLQFVFLVVGVLIAYEVARGNDKKKAIEGESDSDAAGEGSSDEGDEAHA